MPIDIKWVRNNPQTVQEWQRLRRRRRHQEDDDSSNDEKVEHENTDFGFRSNATNEEYNDVIQQLLMVDKKCRSNKQTLEQLKRDLKHVQQQLRPDRIDVSEEKDGGNNVVKDERIEHRLVEKFVQEKQSLQKKIDTAEKTWEESNRETQTLLWKLGSPVDTTLIETFNGNEHEDIVQEILQYGSPMHSCLTDISISKLGMDIQQAWKQYTLHHFANYHSLELPHGIPVTSSSSSCKTTINPDKAHAIWGCWNTKAGFVNVDDRELPSAIYNLCPICHAETTNRLQIMLPTWIRLLLEYVPTKSIWGDKQLPVFVALYSNPIREHEHDKKSMWLGQKQRDAMKEEFYIISPKSSPGSSFCLELLALTASSTVDARQVQKEMVKDLQEFYNDLLVHDEHNCTNRDNKRIFVRSVPPNELHCHEWSRIEIFAKLSCLVNKENACAGKDISVATSGTSSSTSFQILYLGSVSCWGDAASRTCDMGFAGGGIRFTGKSNKSISSHLSKEYVFIIQASVVDSNTLDKILYANSQKKETKSKVPPALLPHLIHPIHRDSNGEIWVSWSDLTLYPSKKKNKAESVFGPRSHGPVTTPDERTSQNLSHPEAESTSPIVKSYPKFPPLSIPMTDEQQRLAGSAEFLSCPFDFFTR